MVSLSLIISNNIFFKVTKIFLQLMLSIFWNFEKFSSILLDFFLFFKKKGKGEKRKRFFFGRGGGVTKLTQSNLSWLSNSDSFKKRRLNFGPHSLSFPFLFFFFFCGVLISSFFLLPPLLLFTSLFHLDFLPHYNICSLKNHSPKLLILILLIFLNIFLDHCVLGHFCCKPIFVKPISKLPFSLHYQWNHLPIGLPLSLLKRKKYHPSLKWND